MKTGKRIVSILLVALLLLTAAPLAGLVGLEIAPRAQAYSVGDKIQYGTYPQTRVEETPELKAAADAAIWKSYDYYVGTGSWNDGQMMPSDFMQFADFFCNGVKYRAVYFDEYRAYWTGYIASLENTFQDNNGYETESRYYFKYEPLVWQILDPSSGFIQCESIIDSQSYQSTVFFANNYYWQDSSMTVYANNYALSSIREWLNYDFYETAFSANQKDNIRFTPLENNAYSSSNNKYKSVSTNDKMFVLTYADSKNSNYGFSSDNSRKAKGTDYAKSQGLIIVDDYSWWWTRSAGQSSAYSVGISAQGKQLVSGCYVNSTRRGVRPACNLIQLKNDTEASESLFSENKASKINLPKDYSFTSDSYNFGNEGAFIKKKYFSNMFNTAVALLYYNMFHDSEGGLCYGYAYSTAAIYNNLPSISNFESIDFNKPTCIRDLDLNSRLIPGESPSDKISLLERKKVDEFFTLKDYVIYCNLYQWTLDAIMQRLFHKNDIMGLFNAVKSHVASNKVGITISFLGKNGKGNHEALAIGTRNNTILIDDSNNPISLSQLKIDGDKWYYLKKESGSGYHFDSDRFDIYYKIDDYDKPYNRLTSLISYNTLQKKNRSKRSSITGKFDIADLLLSIEANDYDLSMENVYDIPLSDEVETEFTSQLYWLKDSNSVHVSNINEGGRITAAFDDLILTADVEKTSVLTMSFDESQSSILLETEKGNNVVLEGSTVDEELNEAKVSISGIANTDKVFASKTEDGYQVSGLNDISVVYYQNDEAKAKTDADVKDGREVNITVRDNGDAVLTDFETVHTHTDADNDGYCDTCEEMMTGGQHCKYCGKIHGGLFGWLVKFFHSIFAIFKR